MNLRELRKQTGLTQKQAGKKLGVQPSCIAHWEAGYFCPMRKYHKKLAKLYGVTEAEILKLVNEIAVAKGQKPLD